MRWKINRYRRPVVGEITFSAEVGYTFEASGDGLSFTVTKSGGGFGTKPIAQPCLFWTDLGHTTGEPALASYARYTTWGGKQEWDNIEWSTAQVAPGSTRALRHNLAVNPNSTITGLPKSNSGGALETVNVGLVPDRWYLWTKRYWQHSPSEMIAGGAQDGWNHKAARVWATGLVQPTSILGQGNTANGGQGLVQMASGNIQQLPGLGWNTARQGYYAGSSEWMYKRWHITEWWFRQSSAPDVADGATQWTADGQYVLSATAANQYITRSTADPNPQTQLFLDERSNGPPYTPSESWTYYDGWYVEDSWCRVLISDESAWTSTTIADGAVSHRREIQPVVTWTTTQVSCQLRRGSHESLVGKYLYVVLNDGTALRIGQFH